MRGNLKTRLPCVTHFFLLFSSWLQAMVRESPQGTNCTMFVLRFFLGYFFTIPNSQNMFFPHELQYIKFVSTAHANEWIVCCVSNDWRITETISSMSTCPLSGRPERWHFWLYIKLNITKSRHGTTILSYVSLQSFIYSLVFIPLQRKLLILATAQFKWPCIEKTNFGHRLISLYIMLFHS